METMHRRRHRRVVNSRKRRDTRKLKRSKAERRTSTAPDYVTAWRNRTQKKRVFTDSDFSSGDGFLTTVWGPAQWHMLHTISFNYPVSPTEAQKRQYRNYVLTLQNVLPCKYCRINLKKNLKALPLTMAHMKNRETFSRYIYELHEVVNKMLGKTSGLSYCDVRERYEHFRARCTQDKDPFTDKQIATAVHKTQKSRAHKQLEKGCTEPLYGKKARCILKIVPQEEKGASIQIDQKCIKHRRAKTASASTMTKK